MLITCSYLLIQKALRDPDPQSPSRAAPVVVYELKEEEEDQNLFLHFLHVSRPARRLETPVPTNLFLMC